MSDHLVKRPPEQSLSLRELKFTSTYSIMVYLLAGKGGPGLLSELWLRQRPSFQREQSSPYISKAILFLCFKKFGSDMPLFLIYGRFFVHDTGRNR